MEQQKKEIIEAFDLEEVYKLATLLDSLEDIFNKELSIPSYYDQKNLQNSLYKRLVITTI